jgi:hypothetical protein
MEQVYQCWWRICGEIIFFGFEYHMFYVLYQFVTYILILPRICIFPSAAPARLDEFYLYSVFRSLSIRGLCPMNMDIPATKIGAIRMCNIVCNFSWKCFQKFWLNFSIVWRSSL